jgi:hypothetical protein
MKAHRGRDRSIGSVPAWLGDLEGLAMATWGDLVAFVRSTYRIIKDEQDEIRIMVRFDDDRKQVVIVYRERLDQREDWVQIASPCGRAADVDIASMLVELGMTSVVGGLVIMGEHVVIRHSLPLENLDINEFTDPLELIASAADEMEQKYTGGDNY